MESQSIPPPFHALSNLTTEQGEPFADLNPPQVIKSFILGSELVTMTESFFTNHQLEVYNFETKVTSSELVLVTHPINRKNWRLAHISRDPRPNILISGIASEKDVSQFQIYILRKLKKDPARFNTSKNPLPNLFMKKLA